MHNSGMAEKEVGARAYFNKYYKYYKHQFALTLLPLKIQRVPKVHVFKNDEILAPGSIPTTTATATVSRQVEGSKVDLRQKSRT